MRLTALRHVTLTVALTSIAVATAFLMPVPAQAWGLGGDVMDGSGHEVAVSRTVPAFTAIRVEGSVDVRATAGHPGTVTVHADDNLVPMVRTEVEGRTLVVRLAPHASFRTHHDLVVDVPFDHLDTVQLVGSGDMKLVGAAGPQLTASLSGSGDLDMEAASLGRLVAELSGSGDVTAAGRADEARIRIAGSGDVSAQKLDCKRVAIDISGSGDATVSASESLDASVAGSGDVRYAGHPLQVREHVSGSGDVDAL